MREIRIFVEGPLAGRSEFDLPRAAAEHLLRVLRLGPGAAVTLFDGRGGAYRATLTQTARGAARARIDGFDPVERESPLAITLLQAVSRAEKMDWVLQKATELGVAAIQPVLAERSVLRLEADRADRRHAHWLGVLRSACEQCGRNRVPALLAPAPLEAACAVVRERQPGALAVLLDPDAPGTLRAAVRARPAAAAVLIGPEGGWSEREISIARRLGFEAARFGPRVLRTETAAVAALAALQAWAGDFDQD
jgi:16S rRNA (uracil1498-N3)-methyltransferase